MIFLCYYYLEDKMMMMFSLFFNCVWFNIINKCILIVFIEIKLDERLNKWRRRVGAQWGGAGGDGGNADLRPAQLTSPSVLRLSPVWHRSDCGSALPGSLLTTSLQRLGLRPEETVLRSGRIQSRARRESGRSPDKTGDKPREAAGRNNGARGG